jgi:hypothetical protein
MLLKQLLPAALAVIALPAGAWDEGCHVRADRNVEIDASGVERVEIVAAAGDLEVRGRPDATRVVASGKACASDEDELSQIQLRTERDGSIVRLIAEIPTGVDDGAYLDFRVELPEHAIVDIKDSSGDVTLRQVSGVGVRDSSGDVRIDQVPGPVTLEDSSGDLFVSDVGDVHVVSDSSGDIEVSNAQSVRIDADSSGEIVVRDIKGNVSVGVDSSGSIQVSDVGGDFTVDQDGSGDIDYSNVAGSVRIPPNKHDD